MITVLPAMRGPGLGWLPRPMRSRAYWALVARFALIGPFVGGLPYALFVFTLPFIFVIGLLPALIAGMLYAAWWLAPGTRRPTALWRAAVGAICGVVGCAVVAAGYSPGSSGLPFLFLAVHGVPAAIILALRTGAAKKQAREPQRATSTWAQADTADAARSSPTR